MSLRHPPVRAFNGTWICKSIAIYVLSSVLLLIPKVARASKFSPVRGRVMRPIRLRLRGLRAWLSELAIWGRGTCNRRIVRRRCGRCRAPGVGVVGLDVFLLGEGKDLD
jgi:hypothetical protein